MNFKQLCNERDGRLHSQHDRVAQSQLEQRKRTRSQKAAVEGAENIGSEKGLRRAHLAGTEAQTRKGIADPNAGIKGNGTHSKTVTNPKCTKTSILRTWISHFLQTRRYYSCEFGRENKLSRIINKREIIK